MTLIACLTLLALVIIADRLERSRLIDAIRAERESMLHTLKEERTASAAGREQATASLIALVNDLCQRVQAPEQAVLEHTARVVPADHVPQAVNPEDDRSYWQAQGLTTEQLAELAFAEELAG